MEGLTASSYFPSIHLQKIAPRVSLQRKNTPYYLKEKGEPSLRICGPLALSSTLHHPWLQACTRTAVVGRVASLFHVVLLFQGTGEGGRAAHLALPPHQEGPGLRRFGMLLQLTAMSANTASGYKIQSPGRPYGQRTIWLP